VKHFLVLFFGLLFCLQVFGWFGLFESPKYFFIPVTKDITTSTTYNNIDANYLDDLADVSIVSPSVSQYLRYNGGSWVNTNFPYIPSEADIDGNALDVFHANFVHSFDSNFSSKYLKDLLWGTDFNSAYWSRSSLEDLRDLAWDSDFNSAYGNGGGGDFNEVDPYFHERFSANFDGNFFDLLNAQDFNNSLTYLKEYTDTNFSTAGYDFADYVLWSDGNATYFKVEDANNASRLSYLTIADWNQAVLNSNDFGSESDTNCSDTNSCENIIYVGNNISELNNDAGYITQAGADTNAWTAGIIGDNNIFNIDLNSSGYLKADGNYLCDSTDCYLISSLAEGGGGGSEVDTNAATECEGNTVLTGNGECSAFAVQDTNWSTNFTAFDLNLSNYYWRQSDLNAFSGLLKANGSIITAITDNSSNWDDAYTHVSSTGADHGYIDQNVSSGASPTFNDLSLEGSLVVDENVTAQDFNAVGRYYLDSNVYLDWNGTDVIIHG